MYLLRVSLFIVIVLSADKYMFKVNKKDNKGYVADLEQLFAHWVRNFLKSFIFLLVACWWITWFPWRKKTKNIVIHQRNQYRNALKKVGQKYISVKYVCTLCHPKPKQTKTKTKTKL